MTTAPAAQAPTTPPTLPAWARELVTLYESGAASQFILSGNVNDRMVIPAPTGPELGSLTDFILRVLLPRFDVVLSYDLGNGLRVERGRETFAKWPALKPNFTLPRDPKLAMDAITQYLRFTANLARVGRDGLHVGVFLKSASLTAPSTRGFASPEASALAMLIREWGTDPDILAHPVATFLITDNVSDLHQILTTNPRAPRLEVPLPDQAQLAEALRLLALSCPIPLRPFTAGMDGPAGALIGSSLAAVESMLRTKHHLREEIRDQDLAKLKKQIVERDANGLIDFIKPDRTLDDLYGQEKVKAWLRQDIALWRAGELAALPMGYLFCGPVGTGKTFMVECLAGEAGVPVVKLKNFRDKWVGSSEANLETIFRLLHALGRCFVFIDEADQALGRRQADSGDSGVGGRVYSMFAEEMSNTRNRGKIVWILASSRPDLIEVDLKRPGRVDVKIPLFPTTTQEEGFVLLRALAKRRGLVLTDGDRARLVPLMPLMLTPGAAEALAVKVFRLVKTANISPADAVAGALKDYQHPVPQDVMKFQIELAAREATDLEFVPEVFRV